MLKCSRTPAKYKQVNTFNHLRLSEYEGILLSTGGQTAPQLAKVAELVDAQDSGSCGRKPVGVRVPPFALFLLRYPQDEKGFISVTTSQNLDKIKKLAKMLMST